MRARQGQRTKGNNSAVDHANDQSKGEDGWRMDGNNNAARAPAGRRDKGDVELQLHANNVAP